MAAQLYRIVISVLLLLVPLLSLRLLSLLPAYNPRPAPGTRKPNSKTRLLIVLGSGGHTAEMFALIRDLDCSKYMHRSYVVSSGDAFSMGKAKEFEAMLLKRVMESTDNPTLHYGSYDVSVVPRARRIHQSLLSTPLTSMKCLLACFTILYGSPANQFVSESEKAGIPKANGPTYPDLIVSNGPATGVIVILASFILRFIAAPGTKRKMRTIYVESWARVRSLSLSGKLLLRVVDRFIVQWESIIPVTGGRGEYYGALV